MPNSRFFLRAIGVLAVVAVSGCLSVEGPSEGLSVLTVVSGNNQTLTAGTATPSASLVVRALDESATPMQGVVVTWTVTNGGGSVSSPSTVTDDSGVASITYTPGTTAGTAFIRATAQDLNVTFSMTITAAPAG